MMTVNQIQDLYDEVGEPYSDAELQPHLEYRSLKSELEVEHAYNYKTLALVNRWRDFLDGKRERPDVDIWQIICPAENRWNDHGIRLKCIYDYFAEYEYRQCPLVPIFVYCSRSTATLIAKLAELHDTQHLDKASEAVQELMTLVSNRDKREMTTAEFRALLKKLVAVFINELRLYSYELGDFCRKRMHELRHPKPQAATREDMKEIVSEDGDKTRQRIHSAKKDVEQTVVKATNGSYEGCHHCNKAKDVYVQKVVQYLARPGVTFSIHNACVKVGGKTDRGRCLGGWFYEWCRRHEKEIRTAVDISRTI